MLFNLSVLKSKEKVKTNVYRFKIKDGSFIHLRSECFSFRNPWTKEVEYIVSTNTFVPEQEVTSSGQSVDAGSEVMDSSNNWEFKDDNQSTSGEKKKSEAGAVAMGTKLGAGRIGRQIAEEMIEMQRGFNTTLADSTNSVPVASPAAIPGKHFGLTNGLAVKVPVPLSEPPVATATEVAVSSEVAATLASQVAVTRKNGLTVPTQSTSTAGSVASTSAETNLIEGVIAEQESTENETGQSSEHGNDEAAMSIIMSLLEADAEIEGGRSGFTLPVLLASYDCEILREAGPTKAQSLGPGSGNVFQGRGGLNRAKGLLCNGSVTQRFFIVFRIVLSSKLQVREKIKCEVLERVCDWFKLVCEYVGQH
uniref:Uncharacterized protein n=1 Tax=Magallana gigas TaxID=29159 RepID=A0A8W8N8H9_MAGGI